MARRSFGSSERGARFALPWLLCCVAACALREPDDEHAGPVDLTPGSAVEPWDGAQQVERSDAGFASGIEVGEGSLLVVPDAAELARPPSRVVFRVTTKSQGGRYAPKNVGAIWVETAGGEWVKTLAVWASVRGRYLSEYIASNPSRNKVDAITSSTLRQHTSHEVVWDLRNADGDLVPDGVYDVVVEATDRDAPGQFTAVSFMKSGQPSRVTLEESSAFADVVLSFE